ASVGVAMSAVATVTTAVGRTLVGGLVGAVGDAGRVGGAAGARWRVAGPRRVADGVGTAPRPAFTRAMLLRRLEAVAAGKAAGPARRRRRRAGVDGAALG